MSVLQRHRVTESPVFAWGLSVAAALVATALRMVAPLPEGQLPYLFHLPTIALCSWFFGAGPGVLATLVSAVMVHLVVMRSGDMVAAVPGERAGLSLFVLVSLLLVWQVSRWRRAERRARATEAQLRALMDAAPESIWLFAPDGRILAANTTAAQRFGASRDGLVGKVWQTMVGPDVIASREPRFAEVYATGEPVRFEDRRAGMLFDHTLYPVFDDQGRVCAVAAFSRDITEQKRTLEELKELTQRLTYHVTHSPLAVIEWGPDMRLVRWSSAAERLFGWTAEEVLGKRIEDFRWVVEEDQEAVASVSSDLATGRHPHRMSANRNYRKDGTIVHCEWYNSSLVNESGQLRSILSLVLDVTERKRLEHELVEQAEQLARANRLKDEFLANLSHELRTPMNAILGWSHMLTNDRVPADMQQRGLQVIAQNAAAQTRLIEDVLDLSRIVTGGFRMQMQAVGATAAVAAAVDSIRHAAAAKGVAVHIGPPVDVWLSADPARLQQVLWNLLSNAVKFTPHGGRIDVLTRVEGSVVEIEVRDTGMGITREFLPHVFERFTQADSSSTREHGGLGLGLAIVRHIVELHGGTVTAASDGVGHGASFVVRLPVSSRPDHISICSPSSTTRSGGMPK